MDITGIIFLSGKPGLYKVITKRKNELVAESIPDGKRLFVYALDKVSALEDISIYTYDDDVPLKDVFAKLYKIEEGKKVFLISQTSMCYGRKWKKFFPITTLTGCIFRFKKVFSMV